MENNEKDWDDIIKNMLINIDYHPKYFITNCESRDKNKPLLMYNLHDKSTLQFGYCYQIATMRTLEELKEILKRKM